jgi:ribosomal protein L37AE/L43A
MRRAGYEPRARIPTAEAARAGVRIVRRGRWEHRCPVCRASRLAMRPFRRWRCAACRMRGRDGTLEITRVSGDGPT